MNLLGGYNQPLSRNDADCRVVTRNNPDKAGVAFPLNHASVKLLHIGLDIGSTTVKAIVLDENGRLVHSSYTRHFSDARGCAAALLRELEPVTHGCAPRLCVTGSGGMSLANELAVPFLQEVLACNLAIANKIPDADVVIELGGEDAKLTYLTGGAEQRMNETCAGGTGAFIDQMAAFIGTDAGGLDALARRHEIIYPVASRCGVFARSDVLPLLNEGCRKEDIAASIMQAVASQTISGLACGRPISGKVVFLGGPLHFLPSLRERFLASLPHLREAVFPEDGHFFVAYGAALNCMQGRRDNFSIALACEKLASNARQKNISELPPLFASSREIEKFRKRHADSDVASLPLELAAGDAWLGIDSGSTTVKAVLVDSQCRVLYSSYELNKGNPLPSGLRILKEIYSRKNPGLVIRGGCATGYGSAMLAAALRMDMDEVETVAHCAAAAFFDPQVSFVLDIGGQDIKCMHIRSGVITRISLNEACSAGCGAFIQNFATSLGMSLPEFVNAALRAKHPVDLGTRCTVFMNSRVRQAQKEGVKVADIAAGLSYSVVRNAIYKVMKIADIAQLGDHVVVQGGAFLNDALLRALELELGAQVKRPRMAGHMGAFGAALLARKHIGQQAENSLLSAAEAEEFKTSTKNARCGRCANSCLLTVTSFGGGRGFISGNRCERGLESKRENLPNLYSYKYDRLFSYTPLPLADAPSGVVGIPRALNMYENYPLWFALFTYLGFRVELSAPSSKDLYFSAFDTIPSQTVCYPAKLAHGHILELVHRGVKDIFFPCVQREQGDADFRHGTYNCPVVTGYPELLARNVGVIEKLGVNFMHDFLPLDRELLGHCLARMPFFARFSLEELNAAASAAFGEMDRYRADLREAGEKALRQLAVNSKMGLVLAGHPYHVDPEVHHGIAELVNSCGLGVLTEDSVAHLMPDPGPLRVVDQWAYHSRLYRAGRFAAKNVRLGLLQLVSFGCGLDAVTADQLEEIVAANGGMYAQIKIDEGFSLGTARIRIRSLVSAMRERRADSQAEAKKQPACAGATSILAHEYPVFSAEMRHTHKLLVPQMSPLHFQFAKEIFGAEGYDAELLPHVSREAIELGLKYVNNDACFPAIIVIGQLLEALRNGKYDPGKAALVISQTGGSCRATNYVSFLRKALKDAGLGDIPIVSFSATMSGPGIRLTRRLLGRFIMAGHYGDAMLRMSCRLRPYEREKGSVDALVAKWSALAAQNIVDCGIMRFQRNIFSMIKEFDNLPLVTGERRPRIGLVGEILLKYHPQANNNAVRIIEEEGGEVVVTDVMDFMLYTLHDHVFNHERLAGSKRDAQLARAAIAFLELTRLSLRLAFGKSRHFDKPSRLRELKKRAEQIISPGFQAGEGWLLAAEMVHMLENGASGILCVQPFGCLPNHIGGKGLIREFKRRYPHAAITALDYDAGASEVNQVNRIKLMMRSAK